MSHSEYSNTRQLLRISEEIFHDRLVASFRFIKSINDEKSRLELQKYKKKVLSSPTSRSAPSI